MGKLLARSVAILASATMFALYARVELPWALLGWVGLVPWLATLDRERSTTSAIANGAAMSAAFTLGVFAWFASAVSRYTELSPPLAFALLALAAPVLQPQFLVFAAARHVLHARGRGRTATAVGAACAWVATEWACPRLFADTIGHGLLPFATLRQGADLAGAAGLSFVILLVNQALHAALQQSRISPRRALGAAATALLLVAALASYGSLRLQQVERRAETATGGRSIALTAALVQANLADYQGLRRRLGELGAVREILDTHETMSRRVLAGDASQPTIDLIVWPETVYPTTFGKPKSAEGAALDDEIRRFAADSAAALLFGTYDRDIDRETDRAHENTADHTTEQDANLEVDREYNAAVLLQRAPRGTRVDVYRKRRLFPLTEAVPAWLDVAFIRRRLPWLGTWRPGKGPDLLALDLRGGDSLRIAPLICLDAVDPDLAAAAARRGADLIVTLSNDGWFAGSRGARLHLIVSAFRSIETRLPQLRATNTGISAVITDTGEIVAEAAVGEAAVLVGSVLTGPHTTTLIVRWGDWFGAAAALIALALLAPALRR